MRGARRSILLLSLTAFIGVYGTHACRSLRPRADTTKNPGGHTSFLVGEVDDERGPVVGASVRFQGTADAVLTDATGQFRLPRRLATPARVTAWKAGYLIGGAAADRSPVLIRLQPLPREDNENYSWTDPDPHPAHGHNCGNCHGEIHREWSASGHARSVSNRHFLNLYEGSDAQGRLNVGWGVLAEHPDGAGVCTACHAPTLSFADPAYYDLRQARGTPARGVHCDYCHKIADVANEHVGQTHGRFGFQLLRPTEGQLFFGPLDDVDRGEDSFAAIYRQSRYCASCHEGRVFGVPVYTTYSEWLASSARDQGKQCQTCHMAPTGTLGNIAPGKGGIPRDPRTLANHRFFEGSKWEMLKRCLSVQLTLRSSSEGVQADLEVRADHVGHRVPTGFVDRNVVLVIEAFDAEGRFVAPCTGPLLPPLAGKSLAGRPGRLYAKQLTGFDGCQPVPFWRAQPDLKDSRLFPGQPDRISYRFPVGPRKVQLRLVYRRFWEDVAVQKNWSDNETELLEQTVPVSPLHEVHWASP